MGLRLDEFYDMPWNEYLIKCFAWSRMEREKWRHTRLIAWEAKTGSHLDPKTLPKTIEQYLPIDGKSKRKRNEAFETAKEEMRKERAELNKK